jgi:hypothetical protein
MSIIFIVVCITCVCVTMALRMLRELRLKLMANSELKLREVWT